MTVQERQGAGAVTGSDGSATVQFWITGQTQWVDAYNELYNASVGGGAYSSFNGIPAQSAQVDEVSERLGYWNGSVTYGFDTPRGSDPSTSPQPELQWAFSTSVRPKLERWLTDGPGWTEVAIDAATNETPVSHPGLNYQGTEKGFQGLDIPRPETAFSLQYSPLSLSQTELVNISKAVGFVNSQPFYGFAAGEVLFAGASGQAKQNDRWILNYEFLAKLNRTNVDVGNGITFSAVEGWDIVDVEYKRTTISIAGPPAATKYVEVPRQARIMRGFQRTDFNFVIYP